MTYLPSDLINQNYTYYTNGTYYTIKTNHNCYTQYNSTYCDCVNVYPQQDYLRSNIYTCSTSNNNQLAYTNFTDVLSYRLDFDKICLMLFLVIFGLVFLLSCLSKYFFRGVFKS